MLSNFNYAIISYGDRLIFIKLKELEWSASLQRFGYFLTLTFIFTLLAFELCDICQFKWLVSVYQTSSYDLCYSGYLHQALWYLTLLYSLKMGSQHLSFHLYRWGMPEAEWAALLEGGKYVCSLPLGRAVQAACACCISWLCWQICLEHGLGVNMGSRAGRYKEIFSLSLWTLKGEQSLTSPETWAKPGSLKGFHKIKVLCMTHLRLTSTRY